MTDDHAIHRFIEGWPRVAPIEAPDGEQIKFANTPVPGYVWPGVRPVQSDLAANAVLIQAPGAVGKSAAAAALADALGWPLVDASCAQVGSYSLSGLIQDRLGFAHDFLRNLAMGDVGIIVDALDEAHIKAGTPNFLAFLKNIVSLCHSEESRPGGGPRVIMLSRPDTAVLIQSYFLEEDEALDVLELEFFTSELAKEYIDRRVQVLRDLKPDETRYGVALRNWQNFCELRDRRLDELARVVSNDRQLDLLADWDSVASFAGYAPVLSVVTEYICAPNLYTELQRDFVSASGARDVLVQITREILSREQQKFRNQVLPSLRVKLPAQEDWPDYAESYGHEEQIARLINRITDSAAVVDLPAHIPDSVRGEYEDRARTFIADHPFLAGRRPINAVFADYISAVQVDSAVVSAAVNNPLAPADMGPFFFQFLGLFMDAKQSTIPEKLLPALIHSHSQTFVDNEGSFVLTSVSGSAAITFYGGFSDNGTDAVSFEIDGDASVFAFESTLTRAFIVTNGAVILGNKGGLFLFGPFSVVYAKEIIIGSENFSVVSPSSTQTPFPSKLISPVISVEGTLQISSPNSHAFEVSNPQNWPQFRPFSPSADEPHVTAIQFSDYMDLRAVLRFFSRQAGTRPSIYADKLEQGIVKQNSNRSRFLEALMRKGIISRSADHYYLDTVALSTTGIDISALQQGNPSQAVLRMIDELKSEEC